MKNTNAILERGKNIVRKMLPWIYSQWCSQRWAQGVREINRILSRLEVPRHYDFEEIFERLQNTNFYPPEYGFDSYSTWRRGCERASNHIKRLNLVNKTNLKIFEAGCGDGMTGYAFSSYGFGVTLNDIDDRRDARAKGIRFVQGDLCSKPPLDSDLFDLVYSFDTFEHLYDPQTALTELMRICKRGGYIYLDFGPLYASAWGLHSFKTLRIPYCQFLFSQEFLESKLKELGIYDLGGPRDSLQPLNKWRLDQFNGLWRQSSCDIISQKVWNDVLHLRIILEYPHAFTGRDLTFEDVTTQVINVTLKKT